MAALLFGCLSPLLDLRAQDLPSSEQQRQAALAQHEAELRAVVDREPPSAEPLYSLAYTRAAALRTPTAKDLQTVALDYVLLDDYVDAEKWMSRSVEGQPDSSEAWYDLGRIRYSRSRTTNAADAFEHALRLNPHFVKAENNLGLALEAEGRTAEAEAAYRKAIEWQKDDPKPSEQPMLNLGILLINLDRTGEALPLLLSASELAPSDPKISEQLGRAYLKQGRLSEAQAALERAATLAPAIASVHYLLGQVYWKEVKKDAANAEFARVAELSKDHSAPESATPRP
jgi:Flp pilus assembly protein TadD